MKRERDPTPEEFEKLLAWLASADREYATTHHRLTKVFTSRGCVDSEDLADEVMNRVAVRIEKVMKTYLGDPVKCLLGFADNVFYEDTRPKPKVGPLPQFIPPDDGEQKERERKGREQEDECLTRCMEELTPADGDLFRQYFQEEKRPKIARMKLAAEFSLTANALRIKVHRIRRPLRQCMETCLGEIAER